MDWRDGEMPPPKGSFALDAAIALRLRPLTEQIYLLGERPLYEIFSEVLGGAPLMDTLETYGRMAHRYGDFHALGGDKFPQLFFIIEGSISNDD